MGSWVRLAAMAASVALLPLPLASHTSHVAAHVSVAADRPKARPQQAARAGGESAQVREPGFGLHQRAGLFSWRSQSQADADAEFAVSDQRIMVCRLSQVAGLEKRMLLTCATQ